MYKQLRNVTNWILIKLNHKFQKNLQLINHNEHNFLSTGVTVILTVWKRNHLAEQLDCLFNQSEKPSYIWIYQCGNYVDVQRIIKSYSGVEFIHSTVDLKYFGRFSLAQYVKSKYIWILDDDVIASTNWLELCRKKCEEHQAIITCTGRIIPEGDYFPERMENVKKYFFGDSTSYLTYNFCQTDTIVDFGCNSWFFQTDWVKAFWQIPPLNLDTAEDIHLSATCMLQLNIHTIVLKQIDEHTCGNIRKSYGRDSFASWMKPGFQESREGVFKYFIKQLGWKPLRWKN